MFFRQFRRFILGPCLLLPACIHAANSGEEIPMPPPSADRATKLLPADTSTSVQPPKSGFIRPGGPVNKPVPGTGTALWKPLTPADMDGNWSLKTSDGFALCQLIFSVSQSGEGGDLTAQGVCPDKIKRSAAWRAFPKLNQIGLIDSSGGQVGNFRRTGETRFMIFEADIGSLTLERQ